MTARFTQILPAIAIAVLTVIALTTEAKAQTSRCRAAVQHSIITENLKSPTVRFGAAPILSEVKRKFRVLVWNIHKNLNQNLCSDFGRHSRESDFVLFQEAVDKPSFTNEVSSIHTGFMWIMAAAFESTNYKTGVALGTKIRPFIFDAYRSVPTEPFVRTPKTVILSKYRIQNSSKSLAILNVHAINFVGNAAYYQHINQMVELIRSHDGPLIVAGDFNTWNPWRMSYLQNSLTKLGLYQIDLDHRRILELDHVFVRGLVANKATVELETHSSDHKPISLELEYYLED